MWIYEKRLQFPVNIQNKNARLAKAIVSQLGGPNVKELWLSARS